MKDYVKKMIWQGKILFNRLLLQYKRTKSENKVHTLKETKIIHSYKDRYTAKRHILHMKIVNTIIKKSHGVNKAMNPKAVLIGGGSATGKTTLRETMVVKQLIKTRDTVSNSRSGRNQRIHSGIRQTEENEPYICSGLGTQGIT